MVNKNQKEKNEYYAIKKQTHILRQKTCRESYAATEVLVDLPCIDVLITQRTSPAEYQQIRMRIPDNSKQLENIELLKNMSKP